MTFQGEATNAQLCLLLIIILAPHVYSSAIYLTTNIISLLIFPCVFRPTKPLSVYQPHMIFLEILGPIYEAAALKSNVRFLQRMAEMCDSHHRNDAQLVLKTHTYLQ